MLFSLGHGQHTFIERGERSDKGDPPADRPVASTMEISSEGSGGIGGRFFYLFSETPETAHDDGIAGRLDTLADAMIEQDGTDVPLDSTIPPIYTYFGQFIDHDVTANTDREAGASRIEDDELTPLGRAAVESDLLNLRNGSLRLDSLYGDGPGDGPFSKKLRKLMRFPADLAKMRLGKAVPIDDQIVPLPRDPAVDLLRIGQLVGSKADADITLGELRGLPADLKSSFLDENDDLILQRAVIGDARNDENLVIAQLQVAFLRFHNRTVDWLRTNGHASAGEDELFDSAHRLVQWHYQWLIVNDYLKRLCREDIREFVLSTGAGVYSRFCERHAPSDPNQLPIPLEFAVAAFRFGHTMIRSGYDYNRFFGTPAEGASANLDEATLELLFQFTGRAETPMPRFPTGQHERLPSNWVIEWERFTEESPSVERRAARALDTFLAPPLKNLLNEPSGVFKHLARRNLRRGHKLSIPCAQACIECYNAAAGCEISPLSPDELLSGDTGTAISDGGFVAETPLWFYVLKEAEVRERGERLGMLGSALVSETLIGLIVNDPTSYLNAPGSEDGHWGPEDGVKTEDGEPVNSISAMFRAALLL